jgi:hypothetical protein
VEVDNVQEPDDPSAQGATSFGTTTVARPNDQSSFDISGEVVLPPGPIDEALLPQSHEDSESISNMKKEVEKTEEILNLEDEKFVDGVINYAKEHVEKDIDEESKQLLTTLTLDETKALVSAQIQFIGYNLPDMEAGTTVPSGTVGDTEPSESMGVKSPITEQFSSASVSEASLLEIENDCHYDTSLPECASKGGKCSDGYDMNNEGQCLPPNDKCENGANSDGDDKGGKCLPDKTPCKKGYIMNDNKNCVKKSSCEKKSDL